MRTLHSHRICVDLDADFGGSIIEEFDQQLENLLHKQYPQAAGLPKAEFMTLLEPLGIHAAKLEKTAPNFVFGKPPFVIVVQSDLVSTADAMAKLEFKNKPGIISMYPMEPAQFKPLETVTIPSRDAYLLVGIDRGQKTLNVAPEIALETIQNANCSPLTIDEGIAILTQYPRISGQEQLLFAARLEVCGQARPSVVDQCERGETGLVLEWQSAHLVGCGLLFDSGWCIGHLAVFGETTGWYIPLLVQGAARKEIHGKRSRGSHLSMPFAENHSRVLHGTWISHQVRAARALRLRQRRP